MFRNLFRNNSNFIVDISKLASGTLIAQLIPFLLSPIYTRLYTPSQFAVFGVYFALVSTIGSISAGRYESAILLPKRKHRAVSLARLALIIGISISVLMIIGIVLFKPYIISIFEMDELEHIINLLPFSIFLHSCFLVFNFFNNRMKKFGKISMARISKSLIANGATLIFGYLSYGERGLIFGFFLGQITEIFFLFNTDVFKTIGRNARKIMSLLGGRYIDFPKYATLSTLLNTSSIQLPVFLLTSYYSQVFTGAYFQAHRIISAPVSLIGGAIGQVYFQKSAEIKHDIKQLGDFSFKVYRLLFTMAIIPISLILTFGPEIFSFVFGNDWAISGEFAQLISIWILFVFITTPFSSLLSVFERQKVSLALNVVMFVSRFASLSIGYYLYDDVYVSILIFGVSGAFIWALYSIYLLNLVQVNFIRLIKFLLIGLLFIFTPFIIKMIFE